MKIVINLLTSLKNPKNSEEKLIFEGKELKIGSVTDEETRREMCKFLNKQYSEDDDKIYVKATGGSKLIFILKDGRALAMPNLVDFKIQNLSRAEHFLNRWIRMIQEEHDCSEEIKALGLQSQNIEIVDIHVGKTKCPVMVMPTFDKLAENGMQIRDTRNIISSTGHSMIFGTPVNIKSHEYLKGIMEEFVDDITTIITNGLDLDNGDTVNLAIKDTEDTPKYDRNSLELYSVRKQKICLFFFDFSSKYQATSKEKLSLLDENDKVDEGKVRKLALSYVRLAHDALSCGIKKDEVAHINKLVGLNPSESIYGGLSCPFPILNSNLRIIEADLVDKITSAVVERVTSMTLEERLSKFSYDEVSEKFEEESDEESEGECILDDLASPKDDLFDKLDSSSMNASECSDEISPPGYINRPITENVQSRV